MRYRNSEGEPFPLAREFGPGVDVPPVALRRNIRERGVPIIFDMGTCLKRDRTHDVDHSRRGRMRWVLRDALKLPVDP
ncbi:hypothetical protein A3B42_04200 [Candidatus Daviesbacteria bacterium RIFCSPLOWO2_01_FULL_38_10]|uniref:Uncharacterized protein n=1 Tax=Candidatus Daviesbacteria bacterium GW2011_GWF2_38_6 TaxID=1618432 RepID=A0A0G0MZF7_9BACT|nr:MAG: hypothetical protein US80_C0003G0006 [Candidatus Daviesbacteria bacterium GW2011_GWA2_38_17]KKQ79014.1 MAG: hypothetical protein US99_C0005G0006 [Candidatus Daviesbacteria bacterium GW2011_GWF2_38_6]OGE26078.1 MAG: hypothetical protein A3D02_03550 [Candidatus Daviesbacteria bacterium RIFCSPHIGHO2_02_FULL_39_41]OGE40313.1 MAG: hypothetical protein A3B42_04200 [Candidatus Daviesbacteria bacterium RIFCSPLOWO2_01_FULL_38_10]OGE44890.1 MAG: hypothetical protein A3E67_00580 [Candidatus Davies